MRSVPSDRPFAHSRAAPICSRRCSARKSVSARDSVTVAAKSEHRYPASLARRSDATQKIVQGYTGPPTTKMSGPGVPDPQRAPSTGTPIPMPPSSHAVKVKARRAISAHASHPRVLVMALSLRRQRDISAARSVRLQDRGRSPASRCAPVGPAVRARCRPALRRGRRSWPDRPRARTAATPSCHAARGCGTIRRALIRIAIDRSAVELGSGEKMSTDSD